MQMATPYSPTAALAEVYRVAAIQALSEGRVTAAFLAKHTRCPMPIAAQVAAEIFKGAAHLRNGTLLPAQADLSMAAMDDLGADPRQTVTSVYRRSVSVWRQHLARKQEELDRLAEFGEEGGEQVAALEAQIAELRQRLADAEITVIEDEPDRA